MGSAEEVSPTNMAEIGLMLLIAVLCKTCGSACCNQAGCKTDKDAQKAAFCLCVMTLSRGGSRCTAATSQTIWHYADLQRWKTYCLSSHYMQ